LDKRIQIIFYLNVSELQKEFFVAEVQKCLVYRSSYSEITKMKCLTFFEV